MTARQSRHMSTNIVRHPLTRRHKVEARMHLVLVLLLNESSVPLWPLDAKTASLAHDGSCRSSHLFPSLYFNFKDLFPPRLPLLSFLLTPPAQKSVVMVDGSCSTLQIIPFILACCCCCHLPSQLQPFCGRNANGLPSSTLSQGPSPTLDNFLRPVLIQVRRLKGGMRPLGFKVQGVGFCFCFLFFLFLFSGAQNLILGPQLLHEFV